MATNRDSPILSLATEIIIEIFKHCLPPCDNPWPNPETLENLRRDLPWPSPSEAPLLVVAQICHQWREICLEAPELWAAVAFDDTRSIELLETWLPRARNHSLTLFIESRDFDNDRATTLLHTLIPYHHQWQEVHFSLPISTLRQLNNTTAFPRLERLTLAVECLEKTSDPVIIRGAPLLHFAQILNVPDVIVDPPSNHLSSLHLIYWDRNYAMLSQSQGSLLLRRLRRRRSSYPPTRSKLVEYRKQDDFGFPYASATGTTPNYRRRCFSGRRDFGGNGRALIL
ncbi:F-box domain-containing protein [Mycena venus]|uniref:F-box domain-containing protein n=1 Tax=Mycena venus TaxID=2733690 RepID=A0A8H7CFE5_9AGAR|nr:F-box domain-containing protein [Mycena venus]